MQLATFLRDQRVKRNMTQRDVAEKIGVSTNAVIAWERDGSTGNAPSVPNTYQLRDLARLYRVSADRLLTMLPDR
jgi:transcriptional regulator with XRE-family HTH domain